MGCPVHVWLPAMAALAPLARVARDRVRSLRAGPPSATARRVRVVQRFAPVGAVVPPAERPDAEPSG